MNKIIFSLTLLFFSVMETAQQFVVQNLQCEYKTNTIAINNITPAFSWQLQSLKRSVVQSAYRILITDDILLLQKFFGNIWDLKK